MLHIIDQVYIHTVDIVNKYILSCFSSFPCFSMTAENKSSIAPHGTKKGHNKNVDFRVSIIQELPYFANYLKDT